MSRRQPSNVVSLPSKSVACAAGGTGGTASVITIRTEENLVDV
jgi:hypothetical protein